VFYVVAMPLGGNQIFFEETSLVARPAVSFQECKDRCFQRLEYHGIKVTKVHEEEYCYIPMGGALPARDQRVLALGGAAAMVHASTGYHLCRCLMGAANMAEAIAKELSSSKKPDLDMVAAAAYHSIWSPENIRQRNFAVFGGEFLMKQNVVGLRGFFDGFFRLPQPWWAGFLAGWPGLPNNDKHETWYNRMLFGLQFIVSLPPPVALDLAASIAKYIIDEGVPLPQSVTPFLGEPFAYEYMRNNDKIGDVAAKNEARRMITASKIQQDLPVAFGEEMKENVVVVEKDVPVSFAQEMQEEVVVEKSNVSVPSQTSTQLQQRNQ
jgi:lycopene beta-cyclase